MKRFGRLVILAMMTAALMVPGFGGTASAQDGTDLCAWALDAGVGAKIQGYTVVEFTGGSGKQIVLGYGGKYLSGGSGNDVLCARGTGNTLDGGSGNDLLVAMDSPGNAFYGGSGNDTMVGYADDYFDGGSGRNTENRYSSPTPRLVINGPDNTGYVYVSGTGFAPNAVLFVSLQISSDTGWVWNLTTSPDGSFSTDPPKNINEVCNISSGANTAHVWVTQYIQDGEVILDEQLPINC